MHLTAIIEALSNRKNVLGGTTFQTSAIGDPHIQRGIALLAQATGKQPAVIQQILEAKVAKNLKSFTKAPMLYETINKNIIESELFNMLEEAGKVEVQNAPVFSVQTFYKLVRHVAAENDEFWPLRGFVDRRPLTPRFEFVPEDDPTHPLADIKTAAASPNGTFYFNNGFMQRLLNYAALKQIKPKGAKYEANGGPFPDGYAYIEFLIMHEFMHYSNDDFYYQKIIPGADPTIINWVGDFRSNYLLVKSGFEQLPMGLYNDNINYDRQAEYIQMYRLVEAEMKKMSPEDQQNAKQTLDDLSDDHKPGQKEGKESRQRIPGDAGKEIDENGKRIAKEVEDSEQTRETGKAPEKPAPGEGDLGKGDGPGTGAGKATEIDYSKIRPQFNWTTLLKRFITSQKPSSEETYSRPSRRGITGIEVARQTGAGAMKPGERILERVDLKLALVLDTSGSMASSLGKVFANVNALLRTPIYKNSQVMVIQFSSTHVVWKVSFAKNQAVQVAPKEGVQSTAGGIFSNVVSGGTVVTKSLAADMAGLLAQGYNVLLVTDSDINAGENMKQVMGLIKASARNMFILFDTQADYAGWRKATGVGTANISHMS